MIESPAVVLTAKAADSWQFEGPLASRAALFASRFMQSVPEETRRSFQVLIEQCPAEHTGLGAGTQLGLSVAKALAVGLGLSQTTSPDLAARIGRGERSAVGVHGFDRGGLLVEGGKRPDESLSPLLDQVPLPQSWRVVLFTPPSAAEWHGVRERQAFSQATPGPAETLRGIAQGQILPAARAGLIGEFGDAVYEYNRLAGAPFSESQGGTYSSPAIEELINELRRGGIRAVGQSSWGPTVFAIVEDGDTALSLVMRYRNRLPVRTARVSSGHRYEVS
jgi:beta-RFAP synthase